MHIVLNLMYEELLLPEFLAPDIYKILQSPVKGPFCVWRKQTPWKLPVFPVVLDTITAVSFPRTSRVSTPASFFVSLCRTSSTGHRSSSAIFIYTLKPDWSGRYANSIEVLIKSSMDLSRWFPTTLTGVDGTALNPDRITTLEGILLDSYGPEISLLSMERLKSRKNIVIHLEIMDKEETTPLDVVAKMFVVDKFDIELQILKSSWEKSLAVPEVIEARKGVILMDYIKGETLVDVLNRTFEISLVDMLAEWYYNYHTAHDMIKGDPRLRNFIHNNDQIFGVDYEESRPGPWILDIGGAAASLLDTDPIFDVKKQKMCWTLLETYLDLIDAKRTSEIENAFNETVADTLNQTAIWRKDDQIMSISEKIRKNGIPFE